MKKQALNPYLPAWEYVPDGEPYVFGGRLYVFGSHDRFGGDCYCMEPYVCWSAPVDDLSDWTCHGVIYTGKDDTLNETGKRRMFAPDVMEHNGRYYLYYGLDNSTAVSVAVSEKPQGPYQFYGNVHHKDGQVWGLKQGDSQQFDPGVFKDDDGTVYLYSGFSPTPEMAEKIRKKLGKEADGIRVSAQGNWVVQLEEDMLTLKTEPKMLLPGVSNSKGSGFEGHEFFEASSMRKFNGKYYAVYSSVQGHELCYAMSDYPDRGFVYKGVLHSNGNLGVSEKPQYYYANNHGSLVEIKGAYYIFGHRHTNYTQYQRQGVAERIFMNPDGTFDQAEMTSQGLNGKPLLGTGEYPAYIACVLQAKDGACQADVSIDKKKHPAVTQISMPGTQTDNPGVQNPDISKEQTESFITNMQDGSIAGFKYFELHGLKAVSVKVKSTDACTLAVRTHTDGGNIAEISVDACDTWKEFRAPADAADGRAALYFIHHGKGSLSFKSFTLTGTFV